MVDISVLFRVSATADELARAKPLPNARLSHATVARIVAELAHVNYALLLSITPPAVIGLADHHTLAVARRTDGARVEPPPLDEPIAALIRAMAVTDNHYRKPRP